MRRAGFYWAILIFLIVQWPACAQAVANVSEDEEALKAATQGLCHAQIAMLGESATHGDGHTLAFKVALVERLVDQCGFKSVFFEANHEEFLHINRRLRSVQPIVSEDLLDAVGGLWKFDREFQPLVPFLLVRAERGQIFLGGIDDQLGQRGQSYANDAMVAELSDSLAPAERERCSAALHRRVYDDYSDAAPYTSADRSQLVTCLSAIRVATAANRMMSGIDREDRLEMIAATQRWLDRDFSSDAEGTVNRDRSMFENFEWLQRRAPKRRKAIVWAATVHIAKEGDPAWGDHAGTNFGSMVHRRYGRHARSLGFTALSGSYRKGRGNFAAIPTPPQDSIETVAMRDGSASAAYVGPSQLVAMDARPGAFFRHTYQTLPWSRFLDGVIVFRTEQPSHDMREK